ncbi:MAG TPA: AsmA family protein [Candidatus Acidoferrales bacterium]|nr:AsmA family protein [Candidatus Acidoferrales bacterium]
MKRLLTVVGIVVAVLIILVVAAPLFINVDSFRPSLEKSLSASLNRQVQIGKLSASLFSGGASASQISISDDPAFSKGPFLQAGSLKVGVHLMPLIFSKRLEVTGITVERPEIVLLKNAAGKWNYSTLGASSSKPKETTTESSTPAISVEKFEIVDGKVRMGESSGSKAGKEYVYDKVNLTARNISLTSAIPFTLTADTPGGGSLKLEGQAGPLNSQDSARTPLQAKITLNHADLASTGFIDPSSGVGGSLDFDGTVKSDGSKVQSDGKIKATNLRVIKGGSPAKAPVSIDYRSDYGLQSQNGNIHADLHTGNSTVNAGGTLEARGVDTIAHMKVQGKDMAVNDVQALLPAFGVVLPSGASLQGGAINMDMNAEGPLDRLVITGPLAINGTHLTGFDLGAKLGALAALTGIKQGSDTLIQTVSSALRVAPEGIRADNIVIDVPSIGTLTGNGVIGSNNSLDFKMLMKLSKTSGGMLANISPVSTALQNKGVPFLIQGTTQNPKFLPAIGNQVQGLKQTLLGTVQGNQANGQQGQQKQDLKGLLGGFLGKKKKP